MASGEGRDRDKAGKKLANKAKQMARNSEFCRDISARPSRNMLSQLFLRTRHLEGILITLSSLVLHNSSLSSS